MWANNSNIIINNINNGNNMLLAAERLNTRRPYSHPSNLRYY